MVTQISLKMFNKIINESNGNYTKYIILPTNLDGAAAIIRTLPVDDVYILDQTNAELKSFPAVYQNHQKDIYKALNWLEELAALQQTDAHSAMATSAATSPSLI